MNLLVILSVFALMAATGFVSYWTAIASCERESEAEIADLRDEIAFLKSVIAERKTA